MISGQLVAMLRKAGHDVVLPQETGTAGVSDPRHLAHAIGLRRVLLTANHDDYEELHDLVLVAGGTHAGILSVRYDNDPTRDMKSKHVVAAIRKLEKSNLALAGQLHVLNHWR